LVAEMILGQREPAKLADASMTPDDKAIRDGAQILRVSLALDQLLGAGFSKSEALKELRRSPAEYDPSFVQSLDAYQPGHHAIDSHQVDVHDLRTGMVLKEDLRTVNGALLASKGQELKSVLVATLRNFIEKGALNGTIRVNAEAR